MKKEELKLNNLLRVIKNIEQLDNRSDILKSIAPSINWNEKSERTIDCFSRKEKNIDGFRSMAYKELSEETLIDLISKETLMSEYDHEERIPFFDLAILNKFEFLNVYIQAFAEHFKDSSIADNALRDFNENFKSLLEGVYSGNRYHSKKAYNRDKIESINAWYSSMKSVLDSPLLLKKEKHNSHYTQELIESCQKTTVLQWYMALYLADPENIKKNIVLLEHKRVSIEKCIKYLENQVQYSYRENKNLLEVATEYIADNMPLDKFKYTVLKQKNFVLDIEALVNKLCYRANITYSHMSYGGPEEHFLGVLRENFNSYLLSLEKVKFLSTLPEYEEKVKESLEKNMSKALELATQENILPLFCIYSIAPNLKWNNINIKEFLNFIHLTRHKTKRENSFISHEDTKSIEKELKKDKGEGYLESYSQHKNYNVARLQFMKAGFKEDLLPDIKTFAQLVESNTALPNNLKESGDKISKLLPLTKVNLSVEQLKEKLQLQLQLDESEKKAKIPKI